MILVTLGVRARDLKSRIPIHLHSKLREHRRAADVDVHEIYYVNVWSEPTMVDYS